MSAKPFAAIGISILFVMLGIYLFNRSAEYDLGKIVGLINIIFFGGLALIAIFGIIKKSVEKQ